MAMTDKPTIVLFRHDLRLRDNGALAEAARLDKPVIPAFVFDDGEGDLRPRGAASRWWLHQSLKELEKALDGLAGKLIIRRGELSKVVSELVAESGADAVTWNRRYDPNGATADRRMEKALRANGIRTRDFDGHLLHEPSQLATKSGSFYKVFKPFWNALSSGPEHRDPIDVPKSLRAYSGEVWTEPVDEVLPLPKPDWASGLREAWTPGEEGAIAALKEFVAENLRGYAEGRDFPARLTSRLSPHLAHGEITPFTIFAAIAKNRTSNSSDAAKFRQEVGWREFCYHLLSHNPDLAQQNFQRAFDHFPWLTNKRALHAWQRGATGYPIVDAGMRELWQTGTMHNRVRMIAASFLTKHLLIDWREGERWFWDTLVDADQASNPGNWQWVAGSGADAAPYFRIFNPVLQGEKFDLKGEYVRTYVPELAALPDRFIHQPWEASSGVLEKAGVILGENYPAPIVDHATARARALAAYQSVKADV
ncbi:MULTISPECIES: cryptochrome/photolyase family protein [Mesorhizobium]|uniref:Deoxyribodipyrimidine photo-lyase n=1 Tax=Mesorhizobium denitrificans TaxID=2294114 RepID=A0A371XGS7_9HYPH|nr:MULTISPECIES: deoxyribodipyrimidine photo-lyase [Mesorhizobium]RFC68440.1 deoxyribodipyrimidine photo-lyase [Mesorhizobium denitrificans]